MEGSEMKDLMIHHVPWFQEATVKTLLYTAAVASVAFNRINPAGNAMGVLGSESQQDPQQMLLRLITTMIAGSLVMMAMGYSARV
jgi:hypothetical protein